jgi:flagellar export protein FliJ
MVVSKIMAKFVFKLKAVLRMRELREQTQKGALAKAIAEQRKAEDELRRANEAANESRQSWRDSLGGAAGGLLNTRDARLQAMTNLRTLARLDHAAIKVAGTERRVDAQRQRLALLSRDRRAVELVKESRLALWKDEQKKAESAVLDDLSVMRTGDDRREVA